MREKKYRAYKDAKEFAKANGGKILGVEVVTKFGYHHMIVGYAETSIKINRLGVTFDELLFEGFTYPDGKPCGVAI